MSKTPKDRRYELNDLLEQILGSNHVYYQPPESKKILYPAIVYSRDDIQNTFADNNVYLQNHSYTITVIDKNPDSDIVQQVSRLPKVRFERHFTSDNLNHDVFQLFY